MSDIPPPSEEPKKEGEDLTLPAEPKPTALPSPKTDELLLVPETDTPPVAPAPKSEPMAIEKPMVQSAEEDLTPPTKKKVAVPTGLFQKRINFQDILISLGSGVLGGGVVLLLSFLSRFPLTGAFTEMGTNIQYPVEVALLGGLAFFVALGLGIWQRVMGLIAALVSGILTALVLFAIWQVNLGNGTELEGVNQLLYGIPGIATAIGLSALGGWVGMQVRRAFSAPSALSVPAKVGVGAVAIWVVGELATRITTAFVFPPATQGTLLPMVIPFAIAYPLITAVIVLVGYRGGIKREDWGYRWSGVNLAIGSVVGLVLFALTFFLTRQLDAGLFGALATSATAQLENMITNSPEMWLRAAYIGVFGLLIPITEEWVWRGVVQSGLTKGMGQVTGFIVTALAYVLKYLLVSLSIVNLTTLLLVALVLGLVRARAGTAASTVTHIVTNLLTAVILILT